MKPLICFLIILLLVAGCAGQKSNLGVPEPYYAEVSQKYGVDNLREYLGQREWVKTYKADKFDCGEMSSYLEWDLENQGFHTYIMVGQYEGNWHSWVEVEIVPRKYIIVEATTLDMVALGSDEARKYYWTQSYETIYGALKVSSSAFDWWN